MRRAFILITSMLVVLGVPAPGYGHGDLQSTSPEAGSTLRKTPKRVTITLTEAPTRGAEARAVDGCKKAVPAALSVEGSDIVLSLEGGEPGRWKVSYRAVSSVDGHQTRGTLAFKVAGTKDCAAGDDAEIDAPDNPGIVDNPNPPDEGGSSWLLWVLGGTVVVAAGAFLIRRSA